VLIIDGVPSRSVPGPHPSAEAQEPQGVRSAPDQHGGVTGQPAIGGRRPGGGENSVRFSTADGVMQDVSFLGAID
jgi:hypothetical protein